MNGLSNPDETYGEYSLVSVDDLITFWRSVQRSRSQKAMVKASTLTLTIS